MRKLGLIEKEYELQEVAQNVASQMGFVGRVPWFCSGSVARITQKVGDDELSRVVRAHDSAKDRLDGEDKPARGVVGELKNDMIRMFEIEKKKFFIRIRQKTRECRYPRQSRSHRVLPDDMRRVPFFFNLRSKQMFF